jgi:hypothetical protein
MVFNATFNNISVKSGRSQEMQKWLKVSLHGQSFLQIGFKLLFKQKFDSLNTYPFKYLTDPSSDQAHLMTA